MNGREIEHLLTLIDQNIAANQTLARQEIFRYLADHEGEVVDELRSTSSATIPTSSGSVKVTLRELQQAAA